MDKDLEALFKILQKKGVFKTEESMMKVIESEGIEVLFPVIPKGMFDSVESFASAFPGAVKKKDESELFVQEEGMESTTPVVEEEPISSEYSEDVDAVDRRSGTRRGSDRNSREVSPQVGYEAGRRHRGQRSVRAEQEQDLAEQTRRARAGGERGEVVLATGEKDTALERTFGKFGVTDFFGDIWRAGAKGIETGNTVDEALEVMYKGKDASSQDIQDYLDASESLADRGESDEMRSFNQAFEAAGGGAWGFLMGMWDSPTAVSEIAITSITQMANPASIAAAAAVVGAGTAGGAGIGALAGGVGAIPGAGIGAAASLPYAIGAAGATLEAGLSFSEFLQEEIGEKGLELDEAGVRAVFADPEAMLRIRMKAAGRGAVIGIIDGMTAGVAGKIGAGITKGGVATTKSLAKSKLKALAAGTVVEGIGGGLGEATARAVVGQEMDALEIGFEMVGGGPGSILSVGPTLLGKGKYAFGPDGAPMSREEMIAMVTDTDDATFAGAKLKIKGDPGLKLLAEERKTKLRKQAGITQSMGTELDGLSPEGRKAAIELETELSEMGSPITRKGKASKKTLQDKLDALYENDPGIAEEVVVAEDVEAAQDDVSEEASDFEALMNEVSPSVEEDVAVAEEVEETTPEVEEATTEEAIQALEVEDALRERITGKPEPTLQTPEVVEKKRQELTKQKQDAIQESITEEVDVQEQTPDGQPMGEGDASGGTSIESESQTETAPTTTEEIELTAGFDAEGVEVKAPNRKGKKVNDSLTVLDQTEEDSHYGSKDFKDSNPGSDKNSHEKMLLGRAQKAVKAIQALFPGLNIVMHRSDATYKDHVSTNSRGAFNSDTNTIHINMPKATGKTIGHEVFHAILKAKFGSEVSIQRATKLMLKSLRRGINKSTSLSKEQVLQLEKYSQIFEGDQAVVQEEEFLAEFVGLLSETYTKLEVPQQTVIKKWIVKVAKMLGIPSEDVLTESDRDVIDLLNTIAGKVTEGKEIAEADIKSLEKLKDKKKPAAKKPAAKKPVAKKPAAKKPAVKKPSPPSEQQIKERSKRKQAEIKQGSPEQQRLKSRQEDKAGIKSAKEAGISVIPIEEHTKLEDKYSKRKSAFLKGGRRKIKFTYKGKEYSVLGIPGDLNSKSERTIKERFYIQDSKGKPVSHTSKLASAFTHALLENDGNIGAEAYRKQMLLPETSLVTDFTVEDKGIKTQAITAIEEGGSVNIGEASLIQKSDIKTQAMSFPSEPGPLSFVTEKDKVDIKSLIDNIVENDETVWFWTADQLGRGEYGDVVVDKQHYLDAGPSYALDPENRKKRAVWASGLGKGTLKKGVEKSDYIFIMSGSPQASMRFNKQVFSVLEERVNQAGGFGAFKEAVMESKPVKAVREVMEKHDSFDSLKKSPDRKKLLNSFAEVETKKDTPLKRTLEKFNAFLDMDSMRDSFYRDNDFKQNDIMLVLKPTEVGGESAHSTYTTDILGEVIGVPDVKIDAADIATGDARAKIDSLVEQTGKRRAVEAQVLAPYGTGPGKKIRKAPKQAAIKTQAIGEQASVDEYLSEQNFFQETSPFAWAVDEVGKETLQDSQIREYKGTFGVVTPDGDIKGLFNPNVARERKGKVAEKGTLKGLMPLLIEAGGKKLDNFDGRLTKMYEGQGFKVVARTPFNEEFAPEGWNKKDHGTPDVVAMVYDPEGNINVEEKTFDEYDDAMAYRDEVIDGGDVKTQAMTAPNGKPSNLTPEQQELVNTPAFKKWFGDSKIVDENGEPKMVSHFTDKEFDVFKYKESGFHFGDASIQEDLEIAKDKDFPIELEVFLNIRNPLRIEDSHRFDPSVLIKQLVKNDIITEAKADELENTFYEIEENLTEDEYEDSNALVTKQSDVLIKELQDLGYDGMVYENKFDSQDSKLSYLLDEELSKIYIRNDEGVFVGDIIPESESKTRQFLTFDSKSGETYVFKSNDGDPISSANKKRIKKLLDDGDVVSTVNSPKEHSDFDLFTGPKDFKDSFVAFEPNQIKLADGTNKTFSPDSDSIKTQIFNPKNTAEDIIKFGRENNFSDAAIKDYLVRVKKLPIRDKVDKKTKKVIEGVDTLMALDSIPASFGNVKGGVKVGKKLFARVEKFRAKLIKENEKRKAGGKGMPPFSEAEIMDQTIEFLESQPAYIKEGTKQKMETDQQTQMIIDMQKSLGVNPTKGMNTRIRSMRQKMMDRRKGAKGLQAVKRELRNFIRQALPTIKGDTYSKSELMKLLGKVAKADEKNINNLMEEVVDIVTTRQVKALDAKIESVLNGTYEVVQAGRLKGVKIDTDTRERLERIKDAVTDEAMTEEDIVESNLGLNEEFNVLNEKPNQTEEDRNKMVDLAAIMSINNSKLMEDVDIDKLESLSTAEDLLADIIGEGKEAFKEQLKADHERYVSNLVRVYKTVTGETIDPSNPEVMQEAKDMLMDQKNRKESRAAEKGLKKYLRRLIEKISGFKKSSESVEGLMEIIAEAPGEILGGDARKIVYEGLNAGTRVYKKRMMEATKVIQDKVKEIYGKSWRTQSRVNSVRKNTGVYRTGGKEAIARAQAKYDANPTKLNKRNLAKVKESKTINLSPNEIAQQWQQYQDPANLPSFANEKNLYFGEDHARIMAELVETIGGEDGKILEMAKWQVEEFYPSMYPHLNEAYKKIYRTNMPWNVHYAGRIKREGVESEGIDLLGRKESFNTQIGAPSTKVRIKNAKPIQPMDMMGAMVTYTTDMEWFAAMGPTIRDIDKLFSNPLMRNAIENVAGESTMRLIDHHMKNIAARGVNTERGQDMVNAMNNMFATTRLGFSPNIAIKQLTSIPTYALDIGAGNYAYHAVKNKTEFLKVFNEIRNNSVYLQDRVSSDIRQVTESYSGKQDIDFVPKSASSWFMNTMMGFIKAGDITAIYLGGMPNYSFYKAEYMKANPNATEQQAIDHAIVKFESDTKSTQQSMDLQDKDFYQTSGPIARSFNLFKTSQKQYLRKEFSGLRNMRRGFRDGNMKQAAKGAVKFATFHAMMPVLFQFIASGLPGLMSDWDEEDGEDMIRAAVIGNFNSLFIVGDIVQGISDHIQDKPYADRGKSLPVYEFFGEIGRQYGRYTTLQDPEKKQEAFMKMMTRLGELVTGGKIPMYNLRRMYMNLEKAGEAKDEREAVLRLLNYSDYVIEGPGSDKDISDGSVQGRQTTSQSDNATKSERKRTDRR